MTDALPDCQHDACSTRLVLREVLDQYFREAERGVCDTGRYRCRYYSWGQGPVLLFIPGLCDEALSFVLPIARLKDHFRCIAFDLPSGLDDGARLGRYRHADHVADVLALLDHLAVKQAYLFGSSFGSTIALGALALKPERFPRGLAGRLRAGHSPMRRSCSLPGRATGAVPWPASPFEIVSFITTTKRPSSNVKRTSGISFCTRSGALPMAAVARCALILHRVDLRPLLPHIRQPVLLICGDRDPLVGKACENELQNGLPMAARAEVENCGHLAQYSHPEVLAELVQRFLTPGAAASS